MDYNLKMNKHPNTAIENETLFDYTIEQYLRACRKFNEICQPLFKATPITNVGYLCFFKDRRVIPLNTDSHYFAAYLKERHYIEMCSPYNFEDLQTGYYKLGSLFVPEGGYSNTISTRQQYGLYNEFVIFKKYDDYCDTFTIAFPKESEHDINFCLNNMDKINKFFASIIKDVYKLNKTLLKLPLTTQLPNETEQMHPFLLAHRNNFLGQHLSKEAQAYSLHLTNREKSILYHCLQGLSAKEIAKEEDITFRTVQNHLEHIKSKYQCKSVTQLLSLFIDPGKLPT